MINKVGIKFLIIFAVIVLGGHSCLGMDTVTCEKKGSLQQVVSQKLIEGTFDKLEHKIIQKMLNELYDKKDFDNLVGQIDQLNCIGDQVNQSDILVRLFTSVRDHNNGQNNPLKTWEQLEKAVKKIGIVPAALKEWTRHELDGHYSWSSTSIWGDVLDMTAFCQLYQSVLAGDLISNDYYQIGMVLYICPKSRKSGVEFLEQYLVRMRDFEVNNEMITTACALNFLQDSTLGIGRFENLKFSPEELVAWTRKNYSKLECFNKGMSHYIYNYIVNNFRALCSIEDHIMRDFLFCKMNNYPGDYLIFASEKDKQFLSPTFDSLSQSFSFFELKSFCENLAKKNIDQAKTRQLGFFSLLLLRELVNHRKEDSFNVTLDILGSQMKYSDSKPTRIEDSLFASAHQAYCQRPRVNPALDSYRLGKAAYKIVKKWDDFGREEIDKFNKLYFTKKLQLSKDLFLQVLKQDPLPLTLSKSYRYLALIKSMEKDTKAAKDYLDEANFWKDEEQSKKIASLRLQIAKSAFAENDYSEALSQYGQIGRIAPTGKQLRNFWFLKQVFYPYVGEKRKASVYCDPFDHWAYEKYVLFDYQINTLGILDKESDVIKLLSLNKLGYKDAADQLFGSLLEDKRSNMFLLPLFEKAKDKQDNEDVCLLYKLMKHHRCYFKDKIGPYLSAQFNLHNFEEVCTEAEAYLSQEVDDLDALPVMSNLIRAYSNLSKRDHFERYLDQYIGLAQKFLTKELSQKQKDKTKESPAIQLIRLHNEMILHYTMCDNIQKEFRRGIIERFLSEALPISCEKYILMACFLSLDYQHQAAYNSLVKAVSFNNGVRFDIDQTSVIHQKASKDFEGSHKALKVSFSQILDSLLQLGKWDDLENFVKYLEAKHKIHVKITKQQGRNRKVKASKQDISGSVRQHIIKSVCEESAKKYQGAETLVKSLHAINSDEWQKLKGAEYDDLIEKANNIFNLCAKDFEMLNNLSKGNATSPELIEKARKAYNDFDRNICLLNQMLSKPLAEISALRKKEEKRKSLEDTYQISEANFLGGGGTRENYRASQKLCELQSQQKQVLIEARQKVREQKRAHLQMTYQENLLNKEAIEEKIPSDTLLVECNILPSSPKDYTQKHSILLHRIMGTKFNLNDRDQETLRIILTRGERAFQITSNHIIKLFSKFIGFTDDVHHGGSHEKVSGMGLTLMPNANGIKKGSYWGQIEEAKEKIIIIIAKILTIKDLECEAIHKPL